MSKIWQVVGVLAELPQGELVAARDPSLEVVLLRLGDEVFAYLDRCSHQNIKLSDFGRWHEGSILCQAHGARFCAQSGAPRCFPGREALRMYPVRVVAGQVEVARDAH